MGHVDDDSVVWDDRFLTRLQFGADYPERALSIHVAGQTFRNNQPWDPYLLAFDVPPLTDQLSCPFSVDGHSHFPIFIADNTSFGSGGLSTGHYEYRVRMTDTTGNGWSITVRFTVRPGKNGRANRAKETE